MERKISNFYLYWHCRRAEGREMDLRTWSVISNCPPNYNLTMVCMYKRVDNGFEEGASQL